MRPMHASPEGGLPMPRRKELVIPDAALDQVPAGRSRCQRQLSIPAARSDLKKALAEADAVLEYRARPERAEVLPFRYSWRRCSNRWRIAGIGGCRAARFQV